MAHVDLWPRFTVRIHVMATENRDTLDVFVLLLIHHREQKHSYPTKKEIPVLFSV